MRIAFYAPLKSPVHETPSGDRRVARSLIEALELAGHSVALASNFRSLDIDGDDARQAALQDEGIAHAEALLTHWRDRPAAQRPQLWFTYHVYYKAPDWLGPRISAGLGIPYVIAEASHAPKRAGGPWALGHDAAAAAIRAADLVLCPTRDDVACVEGIVAPPGRIRLLPPFLDPTPYRNAALGRVARRASLSAELGIDAAVPWIVVAAMMRPGDKLSSYRMLARVLGRVTDLAWFVVVAGDGTARQAVHDAFEAAIPGRARLMGERSEDELAQLYAACDLSVWPAINEAYGMAMLEAQAAGLPIVSRAVRGVPDVVCDGRTGLLAPPDDESALAVLTRRLLVDRVRSAQMGREAASFVAAERSIAAAATVLGLELQRFAPEGSNRVRGAGLG